MSGNSYGKLFKITTWGESHGRGLGVVIEGCPAGLPIKESEIQLELNRRRTGQSKVTTTRKEGDQIQIMSGVFKGKTTGTPISLLVENEDVDSSKYELIKDLYRPGHADYTYDMKYGFRDYRGGGRSSARETVGRVAAGAIAKKLLARERIKIIGFTRQVGKHIAKNIDYREIENNIVRCPDNKIAEKMINSIMRARKKGDSLGGVVEVIAQGVPAGLGEPVFDRLDADLAKAVMSMPAVKGVEIGVGFQSAIMTGSECNDIFVMNAWGNDQGAGDKVMMLSDGNGEYVEKLGLEMDARNFGMGTRGQRFAIVIKNGIVKHIAVEEPGDFNVTKATSVLESI